MTMNRHNFVMSTAGALYCRVGEMTAKQAADRGHRHRVSCNLTCGRPPGEDAGRVHPEYRGEYLSAYGNCFDVPGSGAGNGYRAWQSRIEYG